MWNRWSHIRLFNTRTWEGGKLLTFMGECWLTNSWVLDSRTIEPRPAFGILLPPNTYLLPDFAFIPVYGIWPLWIYGVLISCAAVILLLCQEKPLRFLATRNVINVIFKSSGKTPNLLDNRYLLEAHNNSHRNVEEVTDRGYTVERLLIKDRRSPYFRPRAYIVLIVKLLFHNNIKANQRHFPTTNINYIPPVEFNMDIQ